MAHLFKIIDLLYMGLWLVTHFYSIHLDVCHYLANNYTVLIVVAL